MKKVLKINSLIIILILMFNMLFPILSIAAEEKVNITFKDSNLYNAILTALGSKIESSDGTTYTITITQSNLETVTELDLTTKKIIDISGLDKFTNLNKLQLGDNLISDITPLSSLTKLTELYLKQNEISDITPLSSLTNLTYLDLEFNKISNITPLSTLTNLTTLKLHSNNISNIKPIQSLVNITWLSLGKNKISDITPLSSLTKLKTLGLALNTISNIAPLSTLTNLTWLNLGENEISNITPLSSLENLETLWLYSNKITNIAPIAALTKLKILALYCNTITSLSPISNLTTLEQLNFSEMQISDISFLKNLTNIKYLYLSNNNIENISVLENLKELILLSLDNNPTLKDVSTLAKCTKLEKLYLHNCNIESIDSLSSLTSLKELGVSGNSIKDLSMVDSIASLKLSNTMYGYQSSETKTVSSNYQTITNIISKDQIKTAITLPKIFVTSKSTSSKLYTEQQHELVNCTLSTDGKKITLNENATEATITIKGGAIADSKFIVRVNDGVAPVLDVEYSTTEPTNKNVKVVVKSNKEIQKIEGWNLSNDKLSLTKEYTQNGEEEITVNDTFGNNAKTTIKVANIDKIAPKVEVLYSRTDLTKETVKVTIKSNEKMQELEGWILSEDKLFLTKEYTQNGEETITVYDLAGNKADANIMVNNIEIDAPEVVVQYSETVATNKNVTVKIISNKELQQVAGWTLSSDKLTLTKEYTKNTEEEVTIYDLAGHERKIPIKIANIDKTAPIPEVKYSTTEMTKETVKVTIKANEKLQEIEGWNLEADGLTLTKTYAQNTEEQLTIYDLAGNGAKVTIKINNIYNGAIELQANIQYSTTDITNKNVTATIVANQELQPLAGWILSSNKLQLTKEYTQNVEEEVTINDLSGNEKKLTVRIENIDKTAPQAEVKYSTTEITKATVKVTVKANEKVKQLEGWTLEKDGVTLTKVYTNNIEEELTIYDLAGNATKVNVSVDNIDTTVPKINVKYSTTKQTTENVTVTIISNEKMQSANGWTLSEDKLSLTKIYGQNKEEKVTVYDLAGNEITVTIKVNNIVEKENNTDNKENNTDNSNNSNNSNEKDNTVAKDPIPQTGANIIIVVAIIGIAFIGIAQYVKLKKYKDVK